MPIDALYHPALVGDKRRTGKNIREIKCVKFEHYRRSKFGQRRLLAQDALSRQYICVEQIEGRRLYLEGKVQLIHCHKNNTVW